MNKFSILSLLLWTLSTAVFSQSSYNLEKMSRESLDRGLIAMRQTEDTVSVTWRLLREDPDDVLFDVFVDSQCLIQNTRYTYLKTACGLDFSKPHTFQVKAHAGKKQAVESRLREATYVLPANAPIGYLDIPLDRPEDGWFDFNTSYSYTPNDCSVGDVDGDGQLELIVKWDPSNSHDNSHNGYTGNVYIDCYEITGPSGLKWRIDLGPNIRAGAHYTQFMVYDLDGDGKAEIVMKTADGTIDGQGNVIGDSAAFWVNENGHILDGPELLTVFSGETGQALFTTDYVPGRGEPGLWGDRKGNRSERYLAGVGYFGNERNGQLLPSVVMCRGYYTRATLVAWDWDGKELKQRWFFDSFADGWSDYSGQGNHSLHVIDVDADGLDEVIYGSCTIDHNGQGLYSTKLGHGDAMHVSCFLPDDDRIMLWQCHEVKGTGSTYRDARTGEILFQIPFVGDCGRCMAADIDPTNKGMEMWSICTDGIRDVNGRKIASPKRLSQNMGNWWDGDLLRELLDKTYITKYNWKTRQIELLTSFLGVSSNNGTKSVPCLQGDILGDWREEVLLRSTDNEHIYLFMTPYSTEYRFNSFLQDIPYRLGLAVENVGYNQPTQPGFFFGEGMKLSPRNKCK